MYSGMICIEKRRESVFLGVNKKKMDFLKSKQNFLYDCSTNEIDEYI